MACATSLASPTEPAPSSAYVFPVSSGFIGRQREMGELRAALEGALAGQGGLVMLAGEPGIGKTRTSQELTAYSETQGARALWGRCYEGEGAPPYWPWVQPLRAYVQQRNPEQLKSELGNGAADIAQIVSEVQDRLPGLAPLPELEPEQARFRLFDSITTFLKNATQSQPLMLVLDDLHWADRPSLLLLEFICQEIQEIPLLIIGTYRDEEVFRGQALSETLGNLTRQQSFSRIPLLGLSQPEVAELMQNASGGSLAPDMVAAIYGRTEGNPLFVSEVTRMLAREGFVGDQEYIATIPQGVRETIGRRLSRLSPDCNQMLTIGSVIGREFEFRVLKALISEVTEERLLEVVEEALQARMIEELAGGSERYQFSHALIQDTLFSELSHGRRVRLHARIAETLEQLYGSESEAHSAELAHHFVQAAPVLGIEKLVHYSLLAGQRALSSYAYEEALAHFQRALCAKEGLPMDAETAELLFGQARAQVPMLHIEESINALRRAFDYYTGQSNVAMAVTVAGYPLPLLASQLAGAPELLADALSLVPTDSHDAGRLLTRYGSMIYFQEADYEGAQEAYQRGLTIAQREKDTLLELQILTDAAFVDIYHLLLKNALEKVQQALRLEPDADYLYSEVVLQYTGAVATMPMGDSDSALEYAQASLAPAEKLRHRTWLGRAMGGNLYVTRAKGDWALARSYSDRGLEASPRDVRLLAPRTLLEYDLGNFDQGHAYFDRLTALLDSNNSGPTVENGWVVSTLALAARITGDTRMFNIIKSTADTVIALKTVTPFVETFARIGKAIIAVMQEDVEAAEEQYHALGLIRGLMPYLVSGDRTLGILAHTMGSLDLAMTHFEEALNFCRNAGYRPELAWTCCDFADTLLQRNNPGDGDRATSLLDESFAISTELAMQPLMERVIAGRHRVESQPRRAPIYPDGLSLREIEVLRLVAAGKSNREIAEELIISVRTVANHVANIMNKTNTANRTEAATYAAQHQLL